MKCIPVPGRSLRLNHVRMTSESVNNSYDENDANGPTCSEVARTKSTEWKPNQTKRGNDAQLRQKPVT
jgi:hypothetical protein